MSARFPRWTRTTVAPLLLVCCLFGACSKTATTTSDGTNGGTGDPDILATWDGGEIRRADVDQAILEMPSDKRAQAGKDDSWYHQLVREIALDRILLEEAKTLALAEDPEVRATLDEAQRQLLTRQFQSRYLPANEPVTEEELRALYEAADDRFNLEAGRRVRHLFKRRDSQRTVEEQRLEVDQLRQRMLSGDSFARLAREHSDSESRHSDGSLGLIRQKDLPPALAEIIFALPEGIPSEPIVANEGIHIFLVEKAHEQQLFSFVEVRSVLAREEQQRRQNQALLSATEDLPPLPDTGFRATEEQLQEWQELGALDSIVLRSGDFELSLGALSSRMSSLQQPLTPQAATHHLKQLEQRERVARHALAEGWLELPETRARWQHIVNRELIKAQRQRRLEQFLDRQPETLRSYYELDAMRFSTPVSLRLQVLKVPFQAQSQVNSLMQELEIAAGDGRSLEALANEFQGSIEELDWITIPDLAGTLPRLARLVANLESGRRAPPILGDRRFLIAEVAARREPSKPAFSQVLDQVRHAYLETHSQQVYNDWAAARAQQIGLRLYSESIRSMTAGEPPTKPSGS